MIFSASHTETSPVSIPDANTPRGLAEDGDDHANRLNLVRSIVSKRTARLARDTTYLALVLILPLGPG
jgi:hypothetical protein